MNKLILSSLGIAILTACSQPPAPVAHKGDQFYGKSGTSRYAAARPQRPDYRPPEPSVAAPVEEMKVVELREPKITPKPQAEPIKVSFKEEPAPQLDPLPMENFAEAPMENINLASAAPQLAELNERSSNFIWPVEGRIVSRFGPKKNGLVNDGINIAAREGEPIWAAASGEVVYAGNELKGYGNMLIIRHANGWMSAYAHASDLLVDKGSRIEQGDLIGYVGSSGAVKTAQLHFGIREGKTPIDPEALLPRRVASAR